jgi:hypothetical protein
MRVYIILKNRNDEKELMETLEKKGFEVYKGSYGFVISKIRVVSSITQNRLRIENTKFDMYILNVNDIEEISIENN